MGGSEQTDPRLSQREKQKTIRILVIVIATLILGLYAMSIVRRQGKGSVIIDIPHGKVSLSLDKPIVDQVGIERSTIRSGDRTIEFTEGVIRNPDVIEKLKSLPVSAQPTQFSGKNFVNREAGFLLTVEDPESWMITYNPAGMYNPTIPVNTIYNSEGSHLNIGVSEIPPSVSIEQFVIGNVQMMFQTGVIQQWPIVSYNLPSETAFAIFTNPITRGQSFQKVIIDRLKGRVFVVSANYNQDLSTPGAVQDLINMIATFTVIGDSRRDDSERHTPPSGTRNARSSSRPGARVG